MSAEVRVTALSVTAIKGTRLVGVDSVALGAKGAEGNRRFFVVDERDRMVNGKVIGELQQVVARVQDGELALELPGGERVAAPVRAGAGIRARFFSRMREGRLVEGPFAEALTAVCGRPLRLVEDQAGAVDRGAAGAVSLVSSASLARIAEQASVDSVDPRRFRMLIEVDGLSPHAEDAWVRRSLIIGGAKVRFNGHVGRCLVTSRDPDSGQVDLPTLDLLGGYRRQVDATEPLPFGIFGSVRAPGAVRVGDAVALEPV